jgi:AraC-like DNA-binding protein
MTSRAPRRADPNRAAVTACEGVEGEAGFTEADWLVHPTASIADDVQQTCRAWNGARAWTVQVGTHTTDTVLPDLSRDLVLAEGQVRLIPRSVTPATIPLAPGAPVRGLRLPIAACEVSFDPEWVGWRTPAHTEGDPSGMWRTACEEGALTWKVDPEREVLIRLLNAPRARLPQVAAATHQSERTLRRRSQQWFGVTPVALRKVLRMWRFLQEVHAGSSATSAAARVGYSDVAHASRELKLFTGRTGTRVRLAD